MLGLWPLPDKTPLQATVTGTLSGTGYAVEMLHYRFINVHLKLDAGAVEDSEIDLVTGTDAAEHPIPPEKLRVFPADADVPADARNSTVDQWFVPRAASAIPDRDSFDAWRQQRLAQLREVSFGCFPERVPSARVLTTGPDSAADGWVREQIATEEGIEVSLLRRVTGSDTGHVRRVLLVVVDTDDVAPAESWIKSRLRDGDVVYYLQPRGFGPTRWTRRNPPIYVERAHVLVGSTVETGQVWDVIAASRLIRARHAADALCVAGARGAGVLAADAALWEPDITEVLLEQPPASHQDPDCPQFLNSTYCASATCLTCWSCSRRAG